MSLLSQKSVSSVVYLVCLEMQAIFILLLKRYLVISVIITWTLLLGEDLNIDLLETFTARNDLFTVTRAGQLID